MIKRFSPQRRRSSQVLKSPQWVGSGLSFLAGEQRLDAKPFQSVGESFSSEIDLKDASARWVGGRLGRMKNGGRVEPYIPRFCEAGGGTALLYNLINILDGDPSECMRTRGDQQGCVAAGHVIKMRPQGTIFDNSSNGGAT